MNPARFRSAMPTIGPTDAYTACGRKTARRCCHSSAAASRWSKANQAYGTRGRRLDAAVQKLPHNADHFGHAVQYELVIGLWNFDQIAVLRGGYQPRKRLGLSHRALSRPDHQHRAGDIAYPRS